MPFTLSHPAAAVPFVKWRLPLSALVVGSMAPDFPYYLHASTRDHYAHTLTGIFTFCVPAGLAALWLFHRVLKFPLLSLLPLRHQERLFPLAAPARIDSLKHGFLIITALVLAATTHVIWDSFTQYDGWAVKQFPFLAAQIVPTPVGIIGVTEALHIFNSLLGITLLCFWYGRWLAQAPRTPFTLPLQLSSRFKFILLLGMFLIALSGAIFHSYSQQPNIYNFIRYTIVGSLKIFIIELFVFSLIWHLRAAQQKT